MFRLSNSANPVAMLATWSLTRQLDELTKVLLRLKAWRFTFLILSVILVFSGAYLSMILSKFDLDADSELRFYRNVELSTALSLQAGKFESHSGCLKLATGHGMQLDDEFDLFCALPARACIEKLLKGRRNSEQLLKSLAQTNPSSPLMFECLADYSNRNLKCSLLYEPADLYPHELIGFKRLSLLHWSVLINDTANHSSSLSTQFVNDDESPGSKQQGPQNQPNLCTTDNKLFRTVVAVSFSIGTMAVILYFTLSTAYCIHQLKLHDFLKQQHLSGLCSIAYWLPMLVITIIECLVLSGVYLAGQLVQCPALLASRDGMLQVFAVFILHSLSLALLAILCASLLNFAETCTLMTLMNLALIGGFAYAPGLIDSGSTTALYLYPPISGLQIVESRIASDGLEALSPLAQAHHRQIFPFMIATPLVVAIVIIYLDFILPEGNGLCLPLYFPLTKRFWWPDKLDRDSKDFGAAATEGHHRTAFAEPMAADSVAIASLDHVSVAYRNRDGNESGTCSCNACCCCSCSTKEALRQISCKIYPGHITWLLGRSGSGKTTLLRLLSGFRQRDASQSVVCGSVTLLNGFQATEPLDRLLLRRKVATKLSQNVNDGICTCLTVRRGLSLTLASRGCVTSSGATATPRELLLRLGLAGLEDQTPADLDSGQRQLLSLANCLAGCAQLVLLDEPTKGLEPAAQQRVWRLLREICQQSASVSVVVAVSQTELPTIAAEERIIYLSDGQLVGTGSPSFLAKVFKCQKRHISVSLLEPQDSSAASVQNLLNKLPTGAVQISPWQRGRKLGLLVEPEVLLDCVLALESVVGKQIVSGGIQLGPIQPLSSPRPISIVRFKAKQNVPLLIGSSSDSSDNNNNVSQASSSNSDSGTAPLQPKTIESSKSPPIKKKHKKHKPRSERLNVSPLVRFFALGKIQAIRIVRNKCDLLARCVVPFVLLILLLLMTAYERAFYLLTSAGFASIAKDSTKQISFSEGFDASESQILPTVCIFNEAEGEQSVLQYQDCSDANSTRLGKADRLKLTQFWLNQSSEPKIEELCLETGKSCLIIYADKWLRAGQDNSNRSVKIALLDAVNESKVESNSQSAYIYRMAVAKVSNHFGAKLDNVDSKLAYKVQRSSSGFQFNTIYLLLLTAISVFPASFFDQVAEDVDSNVYRYLGCLGMSKLGYWVCTFILHWLQYGTFLTMLIIVQNIYERFRNGYYISCIYLPVLVFGTTSNLLSVYTTVTLIGRKSTAMKLAYFVLVAIAPLALNGVSKLGNIPVLALIWLVPQVAPLALILFGINLASQRLTHLNERGDNLLYQLWDLHDSMWNYTLIINSLVAMPTHVILLGLLQAFSVGDMYHCVGQHLDCLGKSLLTSSPGRTADTDREMLPMSAPRTAPAAPASHSQCILDVRSLWKTCPVSGFPLVKGIGFRLASGQCLTLVGAGCSGKSTIASIVAGETVPTSGDCRLFCNGGLCRVGAEPWRHRPNCGAIGYCPQYLPLFPWLNVSEHLYFYARIRGLRFVFARKRIRELVTHLGLNDYQQHRISRLDQRVRRLVCLAVSCLAQPLLLVVDSDCLVDARNYLHQQLLQSSSDSSDSLGCAMLSTAQSVKSYPEDFRPGTASCEDRFMSSDEEDDEEDRASGETGPAASPSAENSSRVRQVFGVLHRGRIVALGTRHLLRKIYGSWFVLDVTLKPDQTTVARASVLASVLEATRLELSNSILRHFEGSLLLEETNLWMQFCLPEGSVGRLSATLSWLETSVKSLPSVEQVILYSMSLDQTIALRQLSMIKNFVSKDEDKVT